MSPDLCIYAEYPRKAAKVYALKCIKNACKRLQRGQAGELPCTERQAFIRIYRATKAYAQSKQGRQADRSKVPHPSTWYNQGRYLDDPSEWDVVIGENDAKGKTESSLDAAQEAIRLIRARGEAERNSDSFGASGSAASGEAGPRRLLGPS